MQDHRRRPLGRRRHWIGVRITEVGVDDFAGGAGRRDGAVAVDVEVGRDPPLKLQREMIGEEVLGRQRRGIGAADRKAGAFGGELLGHAEQSQQRAGAQFGAHRAARIARIDVEIAGLNNKVARAEGLGNVVLRKREAAPPE